MDELALTDRERTMLTAALGFMHSLDHPGQSSAMFLGVACTGRWEQAGYSCAEIHACLDKLGTIVVQPQIGERPSDIRRN